MKKKPTLSSLKKKAWKMCSEYVRRKDADEGGTVGCFTCGHLMFWKESHAGHGIPGRNNAVLLDTSVIRPQCPACNIWKGGQHHIFATKLIREHGMDWWETKLQQARQAVKWTREDVQQIIDSFKAKIESL